MKRLMKIVMLLLIVLAAGSGVWLFMAPDSKPTVPAHILKLKAKAGTGDVRAEYALGRAYHMGDGLARNVAAALKWYSKAANKGHSRAQLAIGRLYEAGDGVTQNMGRAMEWYRLAANLGRLAEARFAMGQMYFKGRGVPQDYPQAFEWYKKAAGQGHPVAQHLLGAMYEEGWAVRRDVIEAYKWYTLAMPGKKQAMAVNPLYDPARARAMLAEKMNKFQIGRGEKRAREWRRKS